MTHEEQIAKLTEMSAVDAAYQKGYADAMNWKTQNHLEHLPPQREWQGLTDEERAEAWAKTKGDLLLRLEPFSLAIEAKLKEKNNG